MEIVLDLVGGSYVPASIAAAAPKGRIILIGTMAGRDASLPIGDSVNFDEAIESLISREPKLAIGWRAVSELYSKQHAFAAAKSVSQKLTERVQKTVGGERIHPPPAGGLGYRGFFVNSKGKEPVLPASFVVFSGALSDWPGRSSAASVHADVVRS